MNASAVELRDVTRRFGDVIAIDHVTLRVDEGEVFGLVGPNGAGKTTIIRMCCGLYTPTAGVATVLGLDTTRCRDVIRGEVGYVSQRFGLYDELTVSENLQFFADVYGTHGAGRVRGLLDELGLAEARELRVSRLSTGLRQRVALAAALVHDPRLVFLDEPTSGVDPLARNSIWTMIRQRVKDGLTVVVTTHHMTEAQRCDRLALLAAGRLIAMGSPSELIEASGVHVVRVIARPWQETYRRCKQHWPSATSLHGRATHVTTTDPASTRAELVSLLAELDVQDVTDASPTIEDTFVELIRRESRP